MQEMKVTADQNENWEFLTFTWAKLKQGSNTQSTLNKDSLHKCINIILWLSEFSAKIMLNNKLRHKHRLPQL